MKAVDTPSAAAKNRAARKASSSSVKVTPQMIDGDDLDEQQRALLHAAIEEGLDNAEAGRVISVEESLAEIRALRCASK